MRRWWLAIAPGLRFTRVVLMNAAGKSVLQARLPHGPEHPLAVQRLSEALSLWCGEAVHVVLAVDGLGCLCATSHTRHWQAALELLTSPSVYKIEFAEAFQSDADMGADGSCMNAAWPAICTMSVTFRQRAGASAPLQALE
jgi:hypothetical protein